MLDYGFGRSPADCCSDYTSRGQHGRGITSRALVGGVEYNYFFLNPLAEGSHEEGLDIPYAGAAIFGPDVGLHNPLAEYNSGDSEDDSLSGSVKACKLSFLAFPRSYQADGMPEMLSSAGRNPSFALSNGRSKALSLRSQHGHLLSTTAPASVIALAVNISPDISAWTLLTGSGRSACSCPAARELSGGQSGLQPWSCSKQHAEDAMPPSEPYAPQTPPLTARDSVTAPAPRRWSACLEEEQLQQDRAACTVGQQERAHRQDDAPCLRRQSDSDADVEDCWLPFLPGHGAAMLSPSPLQSPPQQAAQQDMYAPEAWGPVCTRMLPTASLPSGCASSDWSFPAEATTSDTEDGLSCSSSSSISSSSWLPQDATSASEAATGPTAAASPTGAGSSGAASDAPEEAPGGAARVNIAADPGCDICRSSSGRWLIGDAPRCSISGLAMTRAVIRQLGLLPTGLLGAE